MRPKTCLTYLSTSVFACLAFSCSSLSPGPSLSSWETLFDGTSTEAFRGYKQPDFPSKSWVVENGALKTIPGDEGVDLITKEQFDNFDLTYEWKVSPGGNSGVFFNVAETDGPTYSTGPEMQVVDDIQHPDGKDPKTSAGSLYALIGPNDQKHLLAVGDFNEARILVRGNHVEHWLNGRRILEYEMGSPAVQELIAQSKFKDMPGFMKEASGHIAFQHHGQEVWYRDIRVRRL